MKSEKKYLLGDGAVNVISVGVGRGGDEGGDDLLGDHL